jgi:hypothetical protein
MIYLEIITLETAKSYLKIDEGQTETDAEITAMIKSALSYVEKRTNHILQAKTKVYYKDCALVQQVKVFDYPIIPSDPPLEIEYRNSYAIVPTVDNYVSLDLGYETIEDVPQDLIDCALNIVNFWFYNSETKNAENSIPDFVNMVLDVNKRFV